MPKTRKKLKTTGFTKSINNPTSTDYLFKSGILSSNESKNMKEDHLSFAYFPDEVIHSDTQNTAKDLFFHDSRTIIFNEKPVTPTLRLETKYISNNSLTHVDFYNENKLLKTPNIPNYYESIATNNTQLGTISQTSQTVTNTPEIYNRLLKEKHLKSEDRSFNENVDLESNLEDKKYNKITIDYDLHKNNSNSDIWLSFSKSGSSSNVIFPDNMSLNTFNGNTVYLYNQQYTNNNFGPYDYIGNISSDYKNNISSIINSPICFNGFRLPWSNDIISEKVLARNYNSSIVPIEDFGFPYSSKYKAQDRHLIKASDYISKPFVLEKVNIECKISNWSFTKTETVGQQDDYLIPCINFINFFLLNQRGEINTTNLKSQITVENDLNESQLVNIDYNSEPVYTLNKTIVRGLGEPYSIDEIEEMEQNNTDYISTGYDENIDNKNITGVSQRDLITFLTIANYSGVDSGQQNNFFNYDAVKSNVDLFFDETSNTKYDSTNSAECIYTDRKVSLSGKVKSVHKNTKLPGFTKFNIYPKKSCSTRTNIENQSRRSKPSEKAVTLGSINTYQDGLGKDINVLDNETTEGVYVLNPEDSLVLGISLSHSFFTNEDLTALGQGNSQQNRFGHDLVKISCSENYPLKLHLIGYYLEDEDKKVIVNKSTKQFKNIKRIGYYQNEVVDQIGSNLGYLDQNFYDRTGYAYANSNISLNEYSSKNKTRLGNFFKIPKRPFGSSTNTNFYNVRSPFIAFTEEYYTYKFIDENDIDRELDSNIKFIDHYYNKYRFGMFSDKMNYNRIHQFIDAKYQNINKKFMKGFYKQKTAATVKGKISFDFTGIHEYTGKNFLIEKIFDSSAPYTWQSPSDPSTVKSIELAVLEANFTDENDKKIKFVFQIPIFNGSNEEKTVYSAGGLGIPSKEYVDGVFVYTTTLPIDVAENFINLNYDTSINVAKYLNSGRILTLANDSLFANMIRQFTLGFNSAGINITPSMSQNSQKEFFDIDFKINNKGKLNNASLQTGRSGSNVSYENFALEEGDLLNSYNTTSNALYDDISIIFKDR